MKRKLAATSSGGERAGSYGEQVAISDLRAELAGAAKGSKMSIARVLAILRKRDQLVDDRLGGTNEHRHLQKSSRMHGNAKTPYGPVVQRVKLTDTYTLDYVHPCAFFYYLSMICEHFCKFINDILDTIGTRPLRIVVYGDEMTPGNPLRPDEGREAWQWSFSILEFPNHVLHSHAGWIHLTTLRKSVLKDLAGGVPMLAKSILHMLFLGTHNFRDGFYVKHPGGGMRPIKAICFWFHCRREGT